MSTAYLAGFFDGEGSVGISKTLRTIVVSVGQIDPRPLRQLKRRYGGRIALLRKSLKNPNHRDIYLYTVTARKARALLSDLVPYLVVKRKQAELALTFQARLRHQGGNKGVPAGELALRARMAGRMKALNKRKYGVRKALV